MLTAVRDLATDILGPLGASRAQRAVVEAYAEVSFRSNGKVIRPDGLIRVDYGKTTWTTLLEFKTGTSVLDAEQINTYWDVARAEGFDHLITISNEICTIPGEHPTNGLRVRANSPVKVTHLSWTAILTSAIKIRQHRGVDDPDQAWILGELIRYLQHPASGAMAFSDMGQSWTGVRDDARTDSLSKRDPSVADIANRFDQLLRYAALVLGSEIGEDVVPAFPKTQRDPRKRVAHLVDELCSSGQLTGALRIPHTVDDLEVIADLRAQTLAISASVSAPLDRGGRARITWLVNQLASSSGDLTIGAYGKGARTPIETTLSKVRDDRSALIGDDKKDPARFTLISYSAMGRGRKSGKKTAGFIESILDAIGEFYENTLQPITPWQPRAPRRIAPEPARDDPAEVDIVDGVAE